MRGPVPLCAPSAGGVPRRAQEAARFRGGRNVAMGALAMKRQTLVLISLLSGCGVADVSMSSGHLDSAGTGGSGGGSASQNNGGSGGEFNDGVSGGGGGMAQPPV